MAGSYHWQLIFERWADHSLGDGKPTPGKGTVVFRANWVEIVKEGISRVEDEDKYHGHVRSQTLMRPSALRMKCETDTPRGRGHRPHSCSKPWRP